MLISDDYCFIQNVEYHKCLLTRTVQMFDDYKKILNEHSKQISFRILLLPSMWQHITFEYLPSSLILFWLNYIVTISSVQLIICIWTEIYCTFIICKLKSSRCIINYISYNNNYCLFWTFYDFVIITVYALCTQKWLIWVIEYQTTITLARVKLEYLELMTVKNFK